MDQEEQLWHLYLDEHDLEARQDLIVRYLPLVRYVVGRLAIYVPPSLEYDDLISHGVMGLIQAVDKFDRSRGVLFKTYASIRIRGHILDILRAMDLVPRSVRDRANQIEKTLFQLTRDLGRSPTENETAAALGVSVRRLRKTLAAASVKIVPLDAPLNYAHDAGGALHAEEVLGDANGLLPAEQLDKKELRDRLAEALGKLSEREQLLISLYYLEDLTMKEVGKVLDISESRVCQIHAKVMLTLRGYMKKPVESARAVPSEMAPHLASSGGTTNVQYASAAG